jgi:hypothetical protein
MIDVSLREKGGMKFNSLIGCYSSLSLESRNFNSCAGRDFISPSTIVPLASGAICLF